MFILNNKTKVYICCPPQFASGGPELLHQLYYMLHQKNINVNMFYNCKEQFHGNPVHERFQCYNVTYVDYIEDDSNNILIVPEYLIDTLHEFIHIKKCVWWLGINHYLLPTELHSFKYLRVMGHYVLKILHIRHPFTFKELRKQKIVNWAQCWYAVSFLATKNLHNVAYLSDYISDYFIDDYKERKSEWKGEERENIVLYNPKRNTKYVKKLMKKAPTMKFIAIENMTPEQVRNLMSKAKVYIDFGSHPGKDRIPREAAIQGCCIITSTLGSANFFDDVPISSEYKFERKNTNIMKIIKQINSIFDDYDNQIKCFQKYREYIVKEKQVFKKDIDKLFVINYDEG